MAERKPEYTERQLALLRGEIEPESNNDWNYVQDHANDLLPKPVKKVPQYPKIDTKKMDRDLERASYGYD